MNELLAVTLTLPAAATLKLCNGGGEALHRLQVAVGARVMLRRNIDVSSGLVNGAVGTVIAIKAHHITVQFDGRPQPQAT